MIVWLVMSKKWNIGILEYWGNKRLRLSLRNSQPQPKLQPNSINPSFHYSTIPPFQVVK